MDISSAQADIHIRTDANNLVTTASSTHLPEQKETIHMIQMLRKEACSGSIDDLAHVRTEVCLSDCLTKASAKAHNLRLAVETSTLPDVDMHPSFRTLMQHKGLLHEWLQCYVGEYTLFLGEPVMFSSSHESVQDSRK